MVPDEDRPLVDPEGTLDLPLADVPVRRDLGLDARSAEEVRPGVDGVLQQVLHGLVSRGLPDDPLPTQVVLSPGKPNALVVQCHRDGSNAALTPELLEHQLDGVPNRLVRNHLDLPIFGEPIAHRETHHVLSSTCLVGRTGVHPLSQRVELELAQGSLEAEEHPVVVDPQRVDPLVVRDQRVHDHAEVQQMLPVLVVPGEARGLQADDDPHLPEGDFREESLEAEASVAVGAGSALVVVDDLYLLGFPAQGHQSVPETVLTVTALEVAPNLGERRLSNVEERSPTKMLGPDLGAAGEAGADQRRRGLNDGVHRRSLRRRSERVVRGPSGPPPERSVSAPVGERPRGARSAVVAWGLSRSSAGPCVREGEGGDSSLGQLLRRSRSLRSSCGSASTLPVGRGAPMGSPFD